jgi:hypothetical protein
LVIERARRHPVLGIVVVVLLALLLVLVALHGAHDGLDHDAAAMVCLALVVVGAVLTALVRAPLRVADRADRRRGPPSLAPALAAASGRRTSGLRPLRL